MGDTIVAQSLAKPHMYEKSVDHMRFDTVPAVGNGTGMDAMMLPQHREGKFDESCPILHTFHDGERLFDYSKKTGRIGDTSFHTYQLPKTSYGQPGEMSEMELHLDQLHEMIRELPGEDDPRNSPEKEEPEPDGLHSWFS